jgi:hypothetical protein
LELCHQPLLGLFQAQSLLVQYPGYRIRVVSSNPAVTGFTNVSNLIVNPTSAVGQFQQIKRFVVEILHQVISQLPVLRAPFNGKYQITQHLQIILL